MVQEQWRLLRSDKFPVLNRVYEVSDKGNIRSTITKKILKQQFNKRTGYYQVRLSNAGESHVVSTHRQVALAWVNNPKPYEYTVVNHRDEDKNNNEASNLEWCTTKYNLNYGTIIERMSEQRLNRDDKKKVPIVVVNVATGETQECLSVRAASRATGVGRCVINNRLSHPEVYTDSAKNKDYVEYTFKYKDSSRVLKGPTYDLDENYNHGNQSAFKRKTADEVQEDITRVRPNLIMINKEEYDTKELATHDKALFKCTDCGNEFSMAPSSITSNGYNCPKCSLKSRAEQHTVTLKEAQERLDKALDHNIVINDDYTQFSNECSMTCQNCGITFTTKPVTLFSNASKDDYQGNGCQRCSKSRYRTISNLKRYGHSDEEIKQALIKKGLTWNMNF